MSLVELLARAVRVVDEQLARGKLCSIGRLVLAEPVYYLLSTIQVHKAEGPSKTRGKAKPKDGSDVSLCRCG